MMFECGSPAPHADPVHAVVPVARTDQRQAVRAEAQTVANGANAVLIKTRQLGGTSGQIVVRVVLGIDRTAFEKAD